VISLHGVHKSFREGPRLRPVLIETRLEVAAGEFLCICGRSGSGKSTLLNILGAIEVPERGQVRVNGQSLLEMTDRERSLFRRYNLGFVFQFFNLIPTLTAAENLRLPLQLKRVSAEDKVGFWLQRVGLGDRGDSYPDTLSGGEQQRLAIARALIHEPALVLADEPTGNLDADTGQQVLEILDSLCRDEGVTLVAVSHSAEVEAAADRTLKLDHGQLNGPPAKAI